MQLHLDTKGDGKGAFLGFDVAINRTRVRSGVANIERVSKSASGALSYRKIGEASYRVLGNEMHLVVPRQALSLLGTNVTFNFKWTDNVNAQDDAMNLYRNGDTAPNGRFAYRYTTAAIATKAARLSNVSTLPKAPKR